MTTGNQPTVASINNSLTQYALQLRNLCESIQDFNDFVAQQGTAGLEGLGMDSTDAASAVAQANALNVVAGFYYGSSTAGEINDYNQYLIPLWAGQ